MCQMGSKSFQKAQKKAVMGSLTPKVLRIAAAAVMVAATRRGKRAGGKGKVKRLDA